MVVFVIEGESAREHEVDHHAEREEVDLGIVGLLTEDFGSDVGERAVRLTGPFTGPHNLGETEVHDLDIGDGLEVVLGDLASEHDVLGFEIAVDDAVGVEVEDGGGDLVGNGAGHCLFELEFLLFEVGEEVSSLEVLLHETDGLFVLEYVVETDDVGVLAEFEDLDLGLGGLLVFLVHFGLLDDFDGGGGLGDSVHSLAHHSELPVPDLLPDHVVLLDAGESDGLLEDFHPRFVLVLVEEEELPPLAGEDDGEGEDGPLHLLGLDVGLSPEEDSSSQEVHVLVSVVVLFAVDVEFLSPELVEVGLELVGIHEAVHLAFVVGFFSLELGGRGGSDLISGRHGGALESF